MAITVTEVTQDRTLDYSTENPQGKERYFVQFTTDTVPEYADYVTKLNLCLTAVDPSTSLVIPQFGAQLRSTETVASFNTYVRNVSPKIFRKQNNRWEVIVEYRQPDTNSDGSGDEVLDDDPENIEIVYDWDTTNVKETIYQDFTPVADGGPLAIVSSGRDGFTRLPVIDRDLMTATVRRKTVGTFDPDIAADHVNTINLANFTINGHGPFPPKTVKLRRWAAREVAAVVQKTGGVPPVSVDYDDETLVFVIDKRLWIGRVFDQGLNFYAESGASVPGFGAGRHSVRSSGELKVSTQPLNGEGIPVFDMLTGAPANNVVPQPIIGLNKKPGVEEIQVDGNDVGALLLFNFYSTSDFGVLGIT